MRGMKPREPADRASADSMEKQSLEGLMGAFKNRTWQQRGYNFVCIGLEQIDGLKRACSLKLDSFQGVRGHPPPALRLLFKSKG